MLHKNQELNDGGSSQPGSEWNDIIQQSRQCLLGLGPRHGAAKRTLQIIDHLHHIQSETRKPADEANHTAVSNPIEVEDRHMSDRDKATNLEVEGVPVNGFANALAGDSMDASWYAAADPSVQLFSSMFHSSQGFADIFDDLEGFPSTNDWEAFDNAAGSMQVGEGVFFPDH